MQTKLITHKGGCHCGSVRYEFDAPEVLELDDCNCTICVMGGYKHHCIPRERFRIIKGEDKLTNYIFGTGVAKHPFCSICGVKSFYYPRAYEGISINANCIDPGTVKERKVTRTFDGYNWDEALQDGAYTPPPI